MKNNDLVYDWLDLIKDSKSYSSLLFEKLEEKLFNIQDKTKEKILLENPDFALQNKFFFNPLEQPLSEKPNSLPSYYFGGLKQNKTKKIHRTKKRKTRKNRK